MRGGRRICWRSFFIRREFALKKNLALSAINYWENNKFKSDMEPIKNIKGFRDNENTEIEQLPNMKSNND